MFEEPYVWIWSPFAVSFGFMFAGFLFASIAFMVEKRYIKPYTANEDPELKETKKARAFGDALEHDGFEFVETVKDNRGGIYRIRYDFFRSESGDRIALVACGSMMKIPLDIALVATRFDDGTWIKTVSHQNGSELDLSGLVSEMVVEKTSPEQFLDRHDDRIEKAGKTVVPHDEEQPMLDFCGDLIRRTELLEQLGYARFRDEDRTVWSYTFRGGVKLAFRMCLTALRRNFKKD